MLFIWGLFLGFGGLKGGDVLSYLASEAGDRRPEGLASGDIYEI